MGCCYAGYSEEKSFPARPAGYQTENRRTARMTNIVRRDPFSDLRQTMDRLFDEGFYRPRRYLPSVNELTFPVEVSETEHAFDVKAALPGIDPNEVELTIQKDVLTIRGEHKEATEDKKRDYYRREVRYGAFHRNLALPASVDSEKAEAEFKNGMLHLHLPKTEAVRPKQIKVKSGDNGTTVTSSQN
jgi:HSP20 family protein